MPLGTVLVWGSLELTNVTAGLTKLPAIASGVRTIVAMKSDGGIVAWGYDAYCPTSRTNVLPSLNNVTAIAPGALHIRC